MSRYRRLQKQTRKQSDWPMAGRLMQCALCRKLKFGEPGVSSDWRMIVATDTAGHKREYCICTDHFPPDGSSAEAFEDAYVKVFIALGIQPTPQTEIGLVEYVP